MIMYHSDYSVELVNIFYQGFPWALVYLLTVMYTSEKASCIPRDICTLEEHVPLRGIRVPPEEYVPQRYTTP